MSLLRAGRRARPTRVEIAHRPPDPPIGPSAPVSPVVTGRRRCCGLEGQRPGARCRSTSLRRRTSPRRCQLDIGLVREGAPAVLAVVQRREPTGAKRGARHGRRRLERVARLTRSGSPCTTTCTGMVQRVGHAPSKPVLTCGYAEANRVHARRAHRGECEPDGAHAPGRGLQTALERRFSTVPQVAPRPNGDDFGRDLHESLHARRDEPPRTRACPLALHWWRAESQPRGRTTRIERHAPDDWEVPPVGRSESSLSITEAAVACAVSRDTIKRRLRSGRFPNARRSVQDGQTAWLIPVGDLIDAGLQPSLDSARASDADDGWDARRRRADRLRAASDRVRQLEQQLLELRVELAQAEGRAQAAEARATAIESHLMTMKLLLARAGVAVTMDDAP